MLTSNRMEKDLVSVIVPVYNVESYLERSLDSIINQTYKALEIIIINDGSTDSSPRICDSYKLKDSRIKVIHQGNKGLSEARNAGMSVANGVYYYFVDSDDFLESDIIETLVFEMRSNELDIIGYNVYVENKSSKPYVNHLYSNDILRGEDYLIRMIKAHCVCEPVWMYMYRAELIISHQMKFSKGRLFEDEIWTPEILLYADKVKYIEKLGYHYIIRPGSITSDNEHSNKKFDNHSANCRYLMNLLPLFSSCSNRDLFADHVARLYMESAKYILSDKSINKRIDYNLISSNIKGLKSWIKYILFRYFRNVYFYLKK